MPKDDWAKSRQLDRLRKAKQRRIQDQIDAGTPRRVKRELKRHEGRGLSGWNPNSKLWFGKYANQPICEIPGDYLGRLVNQTNKNPGSKSWRFERLAQFLRTYLDKSSESSTKAPIVQGAAPSG